MKATLPIALVMRQPPAASRARGIRRAFAVAVLTAAAVAVSQWHPAAGQRGSQAPPKDGETPVFEFDATWPKPLPKNWTVGSVNGVAVDTKDHIWIVHRPRTLSFGENAAASNPPQGECCVSAPPVLEFDQAGNVVQSWGGPGQGFEWPDTKLGGMDGSMCCEHGAFVEPSGNVWIGSNARDGGQILKFTRDGKFLLQIGRAVRSKGSNDTTSLGAPAGIEVDLKANEVYVADGYVNRRVIVFDATTGAYKRHWGAYGGPPDDAPFRYLPDAPLPKQFGMPVHCVKIAHDDLVYVCDRGNNRIQVFRKDGTFVKEGRVAPRHTASGGSVHDIGFSPDRNQTFLYVSDAANSRVWILRRADLSAAGWFGRGGHFAGQFTMPHSMAVDSKGNIYVGETLEGKRVQRFLFKGFRRAVAAP
jgi:DNA-binding beta-propeller fold protein YncE